MLQHTRVLCCRLSLDALASLSLTLFHCSVPLLCSACLMIRGWRIETDPRLTRKQANGGTFGFWGSASVWEAFFCPVSRDRCRGLQTDSSAVAASTPQGS